MPDPTVAEHGAPTGPSGAIRDAPDGAAAAKHALRDELRLRRRGLPERRGASVRIVARAGALVDALAAQAGRALAVHCYLATTHEVATDRLLLSLARSGHRVACPIADSSGAGAAWVGSLQHHWLAARELPSIGLRAPGADRRGDVPTPVDPRPVLTQPGDFDVVLVPVLGFDADGHRVGQGAGYYDRLLARLSTATAIGLAFGVQQVDRVPLEAHDRALDLVLTETADINGRPPPQ